MDKSNISQQLIDDYQMLSNYVEGKTIKKIITCTEDQIALLMEGGIVIRFLQLEDELIFDIEPCSSSV
ncbi:MAG: hypothetical protein PHX14_01795 [Syntrophomonadaceae bacterium]|nr:hypothetical protein [Syntrophomonadaceae bacterium]